MNGSEGQCEIQKQEKFAPERYANPILVMHNASVAIKQCLKFMPKSVDSFDAGVYSGKVRGIVKGKRAEGRRKTSLAVLAVREVSPSDSPRV